MLLRQVGVALIAWVATALLLKGSVISPVVARAAAPATADEPALGASTVGEVPSGAVDATAASDTPLKKPSRKRKPPSPSKRGKRGKEDGRPAVDTASSPNGPTLAEARTQRVRIGIIVKAEGGPCKQIVGTTPLPIDWPEQQVQELEEDISPQARVDFRLVAGTVRQMVVQIPFLESGEEARAVVTFDISRHALAAPDETSALVTPEHLDRFTRTYLGPSPGIESRHPKIKALAKETVAGKEDTWSQVEALYDWVREHVQYKQGPTKNAIDALEDRVGDCEEMTGLFVALCRASNIPARTVWIPGHCYPEFLLEDAEGVGHWFPCQIAGTRSFGGMPEWRPIYQKGDNFLTPERPREKLRYVSEYLTGGGGQPKVQFVRELIAPDGKATPTPLGVQ